MKRYQNLSGTSGVTAYEIGDDSSIAVQFIDGSVYFYDTTSTSAYNVSKMQRLAVAGKGLSSFISRFVRDHYAEKLR